MPEAPVDVYRNPRGSEYDVRLTPKLYEGAARYAKAESAAMELSPK
jgi:hypothetical protein